MIKSHGHLFYAFMCTIIIAHALHCADRTDQALAHIDTTIQQLQKVPSYNQAGFKIVRGSFLAALSFYAAFSSFDELFPYRQLSVLSYGWQRPTIFLTTLIPADIGIEDALEGKAQLLQRWSSDRSLQAKADETIRQISSSADINRDAIRMHLNGHIQNPNHDQAIARYVGLVQNGLPQD